MRVILNLVSPLDIQENHGLISGLLEGFLKKNEKETLDLDIFISETAISSLIISESFLWAYIEKWKINTYMNSTHLSLQNLGKIFTEIMKSKPALSKNFQFLDTSAFYGKTSEFMLDSESRIINI